MPSRELTEESARHAFLSRMQARMAGLRRAGQGSQLTPKVSQLTPKLCCCCCCLPCREEGKDQPLMGDREGLEALEAGACRARCACLLSIDLYNSRGTEE